ncbi:hypothetical protein EQG49_02395 [Periweissella cryptocerci]|uniref:Uncharacterized protein n=1 Tax=Periweissella cryptocerci TaxID=2506420 RepID=A0A4P6YRV6_9LACO|nr:hypothetical protein [Periweissella cryptocerci]QBO35394.1 hypothetical protein EQG49_02395 [Periweissella cryptocerci]
MTKYRKTALIEAEQFDGSGAMIEKYGIVSIFPEGQAIPTLEGAMMLKVNDWIATGVNGEHWAIADDIFRRTYEVAK